MGDPYRDDPPRLVSAAAAVHILWGLVTLAVLAYHVIDAARSEPVERSAAEQFRLQLVIFFALAIGIANILAGRWLRRLQPRGRWLSAVCALQLLSFGLTDVVNHELDAGSVLVRFALPLALLYVIQWHYRMAFEGEHRIMQLPPPAA